LFKPAKGSAVKVNTDENFSLIDVGGSIYRLLDEAIPRSEKIELNAISFFEKTEK
jgi:hypothetical protein